MTPRPGRRIGRTRLKLKHVEARRSAIAKLDEQHRQWVAQTRDVFYEDIYGSPPPRRRPLELPGHHLQRAAAENA